MKAVPPLLVLLALAMRAQLALGTHAINQDGPHYLNEAHRLRTEGWRTIEERVLVATLLAPFAADPRRAEPWAVGISIVCGALAVLPLTALTRRAVGPGVDAVAGLLYALHPMFVDVQSEVLSEGIAHLFVLLGAAGIVAWLDARLWSRLIGGAAACALAALSRPDGFALALAVAVALAVAAAVDRGRRLGRLGGFAFFVALFVGPPLAAMASREEPLSDLIQLTFRRYSVPEETPNRPAGWKHVQDIDRYGRVLGSTYYLTKQFLPAPTLVLVPLAAVGLCRRRGTRLLAAAALLFLALIAVVAVGYVHRANSRYFSLPWMMLIPVAAAGATGLRPRWTASLLIGVSAVLVLPSLGERRHDALSERRAWESMADRRGESLVVLGGTLVRAEYYGGFRSRIEAAEFDRATKARVETLAVRGEVDAILVRDGDDDPWLGVVTEAARAAWGPHDVRRFDEGGRGATLYLRRR